MAQRLGGLGPLGHRAVADADASLREFERWRLRTLGAREALPSTPNLLHNLSALSVQEEEEVKDLQWVQFDSSRVREAAYDPNNDRLFVVFVKPQPVGTPWVYNGVPPNVWRNFQRSASPGRYVNRVLNGYDYHRGHW